MPFKIKDPIGRLRVPADVWSLFVLAAVVAILWLPFNLNSGLMADDLHIHALMDSGYRVFKPELLMDDPMRFFDSRPIAQLIWVVGPMVFGLSFFAWNLWLALALLFKGVATYVLAMMLARNNRAFALLVAALTIVYPADSAIFNLSYAVYHVAVTFQIVAACLLLAYWDTSRLYYFALSVLATAVALAIYEGVYPLVLATPLLLLVRGDGLSRRWFIASAVWYILPVVKVAFFLYYLLSGRLEFQSTLLTPGNPIELSILGETLTFAYGMHFYNGLRIAAEQAAHIVESGEHMTYLALAIASALLVGVAAGLLARDSDHRAGNQIAPAGWAMIVLIGLAGLYLAYFMFVPTQVRFDERTLLQSASYAALAAVGIFWLGGSLIAARAGSLLPNIARAGLRIVAPSMLVFLGTIFCLVQHAAFVGASIERAEAAVPLATLARKFKPDTVIALIDSTTDGSLVSSALQDREAEAVVRILFADPSLTVRICSRGNPAFKCEFTLAGLRTAGIYNVSSPELTENYSLDRVVVFEFRDHDVVLLETAFKDEGPGAAAGYAPRSRIDPTAPVPQRLASMFDYVPPNVKWQVSAGAATGRTVEDALRPSAADRR